MAAARSLWVSFSCAALVLGAVVLPSQTLAESTGVPILDGLWTGKLQSHYWDQRQEGFLKPKKKYKSDVIVDIDQDGDEITLTITFEDDPFPVSGGAVAAMLVLEGTAGNYHWNAGMNGGPLVTLSGSSNKSAKNLKAEGVAASADFTHEIKLSLKRQNPS